MLLFLYKLKLTFFPNSLFLRFSHFTICIKIYILEKYVNLLNSSVAKVYSRQEKRLVLENNSENHLKTFYSKKKTFFQKQEHHPLCNDSIFKPLPYRKDEEMKGDRKRMMCWRWMGEWKNEWNESGANPTVAHISTRLHVQCWCGCLILLLAETELNEIAEILFCVAVCLQTFHWIC